MSEYSEARDWLNIELRKYWSEPIWLTVQEHINEPGPVKVAADWFEEQGKTVIAQALRLGAKAGEWCRRTVKRGWSVRLSVLDEGVVDAIRRAGSLNAPNGRTKLYKTVTNGYQTRGHVMATFSVFSLMAQQTEFLAQICVRGALQMEQKAEPLPSHAWPGGYQIVYRTSDNAVFCPDCVNKEIVRIAQEIRNPDRHDSFHIVDCATYDEGALRCDHCNSNIESSYGDPDEDSPAGESQPTETVP